MSHILLPEFVAPKNDELADLVDSVRVKNPLVHCITNSVVTQFTANVLLALDGAPAMVDIPVEAGLFTKAADALLINLGTPQPTQQQAMKEAAASAFACGTPWVLDPVAVGSLPVRSALAQELLEFKPAVIRGNASEILALAGFGVGGRGTDSTVGADNAIDAAAHLVRLAGSCGVVVCISGETDVIVSAQSTGSGGGDLRITRVSGGSELLTKVTGGGCALGAVVAAFVSQFPHDPHVAAAVAHSFYGVAASRAAARSVGPGSFAVALIDELFCVDGEAFVAEADIKWL